MNGVKMFVVVGMMLAGSAFAGGGIMWKNLDDAHRLGGRKVSDGYLRGKVVLVDRWGRDCQPRSDTLPRLEEIWNSFKSKPFVLLGGYFNAANEVKALVEQRGLTYPIYDDAGLAENEPELGDTPLLYVVDGTGAIRYKGRDERLATERVVMMLTDMEAPKDVAMWKKYLGFELKTLPGRAFVRLTEFRKKFPEDAKAYEEDYKRLKNDAEVQKLVKLVVFAKMAKDFDPKNKKQKDKVNKAKIETTLKAYEPLKDSKNELVAQEAKNSLADLKWALTNF